MSTLPTAELLDAVLDGGTWRPWDVPIVDIAVDPDYREELRVAAAQAGSDDSVITGSGRVHGEPVALIAGDFNFLAGSIGRVAADRIMGAADRATALGLPLLALPASGGTRMQEGTPAFLLMAGIAGAVRRHIDAGLPYLVYLRNPTFGGVLASWGSLGDTAHAEPEAMIGFLGPRVYEGLTGEPFPDGVQTSKNLAAAGVIDGVMSPEQWRDYVGSLLQSLRAHPETQQPSQSWESAGADGGEADADMRLVAPEKFEGWAAVTATREPQRPGLDTLLSRLTGFCEISGTHAGERAAVTTAGIGQLAGMGCVIVGFDRVKQDTGLAVGPADLRLARRAMALAEKWRIPLVTVIDTNGGELSAAAENGAFAGEIARCLSDLAALRTPILSILLGSGVGGAALALLPGDIVLAAADSWVTPLSPEGASLIRYRTTDRAVDIANDQRITAADLAEIGAVDRIVAPPRPGMPKFAVAVGEELSRVVGLPLDLGARAAKWSGLWS